MSDYKPQTLGEHYVLEVLTALEGNAMGRQALVEQAVALWEAAHGDASESAIKASLRSLLEKNVVVSEEHAVKRGVGTYIRLA